MNNQNILYEFTYTTGLEFDLIKDQARIEDIVTIESTYQDWNCPYRTVIGGYERFVEDGEVLWRYHVKVVKVFDDEFVLDIGFDE
jgi:hypothetical protein